MSFYSLWQNYISMTSHPRANSDRGVMRISRSTELICLLWLSPSSFAHYAIFYLLLSLASLSESTSSIFFFFLAPLPNFFLLFILRCLWLVPRLVTLVHHSQRHTLKSFFFFPASVITLSKWLSLRLWNVCCLPLLFFSLFMCRHDLSTPRKL